MAAFEAARFNHSRTSPRAVALAGVASTFSLAKVAEGVILKQHDRRTVRAAGYG
jgi:hypothetical protein